LRSSLKDKIRMVGDIRTDNAIVIGDSICMMMECQSQDGEKKASQQEIDNFFIHQPTEVKSLRFKKIIFFIIK
jgi:hypothetical protein